MVCMEYTFDDVLEIKNGKNQKAVENSAGKYPIYGSGGVMGYADDYICDADTVIIGRKGSINNPIYVSEPFWNVDTAFGLVANKEVLLPKYLFYFCKKFDFEKLNKTVTIPSLTKSDLLKIKIQLPDIVFQQKVIDKLAKIDLIIALRKQELSALDDLISARFVEMTEHANTVPTRMGEIATYINGYAFKPIQWENTGYPIVRIQNLNDARAPYNYYSGKLENKYLIHNGDVLISWATHLEAYIWKGEEAWLNQHIFKVVFDKIEVDKIYFVYACEEALQQAFRNAHGFKPTMEHIKKADFDEAIVKLPNMQIQKEFADFVHQVNKLKLQVQKSLDETQTLFDSLMQKYFG